MARHPANLVLVNHYSPGDVLMLTAAVRDLHAARPGWYRTAVDTCFPELWLNNPNVSPVDRFDGQALRIDCGHPPLLDRCNGQPRHYVESMHHVLSQALGHEVPLTRFAPDLHLAEPEKASPPCGVERPFWLVVAGGKRDLTTKWWPSASYQRVVDRVARHVQFVQAGAGGDHHPPLSGVTNVVGMTSLREFLCMVYHAEGVVCPITCAMHAAAAFDKPCVVVAGGREPPHWEMYPGHQYLHTVGQLACCRGGGCWRARVVPLRDGDADRDGNLCERPVEHPAGPVAACMNMIEPADVVRAVERYLQGTKSEEVRR